MGELTDITVQEAFKVHGQGLLCIGCGGEVSEWIDGINHTLFEEGISTVKNVFKTIYRFTWRGATCLLFSFNDLKAGELNVGKLAMFRIGRSDWMKWLTDWQDNNFSLVRGEY